MKINLEVNTSDTSDLHTKQAYEVNVITFFMVGTAYHISQLGDFSDIGCFLLLYLL